VGLIWSRSVASYRRLFRIKFEVGHELEKAGHVVKIYRREDDRPRELSLLEHERFIPRPVALAILVNFYPLAMQAFQPGLTNCICLNPPAISKMMVYPHGWEFQRKI
jgi:hypothetical protein